MVQHNIHIKFPYPLVDPSKHCLSPFPIHPSFAKNALSRNFRTKYLIYFNAYEKTATFINSEKLKTKNILIGTELFEKLLKTSYNFTLGTATKRAEKQANNLKRRK